MDVDYAGYLSKHDIVFNRPITNPLHGSTVGNGRVGAMVWNEDGLKVQVSGVDTSEESAFSAGLIHVYTAPGMDTSYSNFQQRLALYDGLLTTQYDTNRTVTVMGSPDSEIIGIHVEDGRRDVSEVTVDLSIWDTSKLSGGDVPDITTWRTVETDADATGIYLSRGQEDPNQFGYTLGATVRGTRFAARVVDKATVRLTIAPSSSYTIWVACASRLNAPNHDSVGRAHALLTDVGSKGYAAALVEYERWWHAFWQKSFVQYTNAAGGGDYLENLYYLYTYIIAAGSYGNYPFHFIHGDLAANGDVNSTKWSVAYWHWNERDIYSSFLASNHPDILHIYNHLYSRNMRALAAQTRDKYLVDGIWVPEAMGWDGNARHNDSSWTKDILSTGAEIAESMYAEYQYTNDVAYLQATVYPFMKGVAQFYTNKLVLDAVTGKYYMPRSNADETFWDVKNAVTDLAAVRSLFPIVIQTSKDLARDDEMRGQWMAILDNLAAYPAVQDGSRYAPHDPPASDAHNAENVTNELVWPYGVTGIGAPDYQTALNGWIKRPFPYGNVWSNDAVQAARLGLGDEVFKGVKLLAGTYQSFPNGLTDDANGNFEYLGTHLSAINESLLQSYNGKIRVFPAPPRDRAFVGRFTLLAAGGFLVSSEYENEEIKYVVLRSLYGNSVTLENPWKRDGIRVVRLPDHAVVFTTDREECTFETTSNTVYIMERTDRPFRGYAHERLTGAANNDAKRLTGSLRTLGSFRSDQGALSIKPP